MSGQVQTPAARTVAPPPPGGLDSIVPDVHRDVCESMKSREDEEAFYGTGNMSHILFHYHHGRTQVNMSKGVLRFMDSEQSKPTHKASSRYATMTPEELASAFYTNASSRVSITPRRPPSDRNERPGLVCAGCLPCPHCSHTPRVVSPTEGSVHCPKCNIVEYSLVDRERPSYGEPPRELSYFAYKRANHLAEHISQAQGRESTNIPDEVFQSIIAELKKHKVTNMASLQIRVLKSIMRKLGLNRYFEHIPYIHSHLSGQSLVRIPPEIEVQLRRMFTAIQVPFMKHAPPSRRNFLSYSFVLHKFLQLLDRDDLADRFPLLKSREKLLAQDRTWKLICDELGWQFNPSL